MLAPYADISSTAHYPYHHHTGARGLHRQFKGIGWDWSSYTILTTIRNPWDRLVSMWHYAQQNPHSIWHQHFLKRTSFPNFVHGLQDFLDTKVYHEGGGHRIAGQTGIGIEHFAYSEIGEKLVTHILPIETISQTLPTILQAMGLPSLKIPKINNTERNNYHEYYVRGDGCEDIIANLFSEDIRIGTYEF